jgi:VanZ family protein
VKTIKHLLERKDVLLCLASLWTIFVAYMCLANFKSLPKIGMNNPDKYVHVTFHFVFTVLWFFYLKVKNKNIVSSLVKVVIASVIYGGIIEIVQGLFTTTRQADIVDILANTIGAILAVVMILATAKFSNKES